MLHATLAELRLEVEMALRVALVGMGRIGRVHLQALSTVGAAEVVGVYDLNAQLARERADAAGVNA
jgi:predicted dehydrogenase